jgi:hypothetical protein
MKGQGLEAIGKYAFRIGSSESICMEAFPVDFELKTGIQPTEVVYSYSSATNFAPFENIFFATLEPITTAVIDFVISWAD